MRWMNRLTTGLIVLTVVAGPPLLAFWWLLHHPLAWPSSQRLDAWRQQPLTAGTIVIWCLTVAAMVWLALLYYLACRAVQRISRWWRRIRRLPLPTPAQMTAGSMAGIAAFALPGLHAGNGPLAPATASSPPLADHDDATDRPVRAAAAGIDLPGGGWIPYPTAVAVTATASLLWLHRRLRYRPRPPPADGHTSDADLQPLPSTAQVITTAVSAGQRTTAGQMPVQPDPLPAGVVVLDGPGAAAAARGLLVAAALAAVTGHHQPIRVRHGDLTDLLSDTGAAHLPGVQVDHNATVPHPAAHEQRGDPGPPPRRPAADRPGKTLILLGDDPTATVRWHVTRDGMTTGTGLTAPRRLCVLDQQAATDLITLARHAGGYPSNNTTPAAPPKPRPAAPGHLALLGRCELTIAGQPVRLRRSAGLQALCYLAVHPGGATGTDLLRACWPGLPPSSITQRLYTTLNDVRGQLQRLLGADPISRRDDRYHLNTDVIDTDVRSWRAAVHAATHAIGGTARLHATRAVIGQYRGDLAAGHDWPWLVPLREALRRDALDAYAVLAATADPAQAAALLQQAVTLDLDRYNHDLHHRAADALHAIGDHDGATAVITAFRQRCLRAGLGDDQATPDN
jgi:DNA-binding SARP family transcriptional activator